MKKLFAIVLLLVAMVVSQESFAQVGHRGPHKRIHHKKHFPRHHRHHRP